MITFDSVSKSFVIDVRGRKHIALRELSFQVEAGECLGLIGANGAGKSTSIRLLMDFIRPDSGRIELFGQARHQPQLRTRIGYLPDVAMFPPSLTVLDLLRFTARTCGISSMALAQRSQELLTMLDLWEVRRRPLRKFSKGMQQRANFAVALVNDPELLILDEPMSGLDPIGREKISTLISRLKQQGKTILFCSHILYDVDRLVDNVLLLDQGRRLFFGPPAELVREEVAQNLSGAFVSRINRVRQEEAHV
ncbi:MAG: ABC transporter ATP-binding protein [bacterium]|nr:ABC transporter ATP-binding protein [bacterium]